MVANILYGTLVAYVADQLLHSHLLGGQIQWLQIVPPRRTAHVAMSRRIEQDKANKQIP